MALDALDHNRVLRYNCRELMQQRYGQTDVSNFNFLRTVVLWASFLTGKNMEDKIPVNSQWEYKLKSSQTFFKFFKHPKAIDVPSYNLNRENHAEERRLLKAFFDDEISIEDYDATIWKNHEENKKEFFSSIGKSDIVMAYFDLADAVGHLSFGDLSKIEEVYRELDTVARDARTSTNEILLIVSDHGMKCIGRFGDHSSEGFYSVNQDLRLDHPHITDFFGIIEANAEK